MKIKLFEEFHGGDFTKKTSISPLKEVTEDTYYDMIGAVPPIYVSSINGEKLSGFAVSEPYSSKNNLPTFNVYFEVDDKYYTTVATLMDKDGKPMTHESYNNYEMTKGNKATSINTVRPFVGESELSKVADDPKRFEQREDQLEKLGFKTNGTDFVLKGVWSTYWEQVNSMDDEEWIQYINDIEEAIESKKETVKEGRIESPEKIQAEIDKLEKENKEGYAEDIKKLKTKLTASKLLHEKEGNSRDVSKTKEIMNNVRNIMMLKPDMPFVTIMYNALDHSDLAGFDDEDVLSKLQHYEKFLHENK